MPATTVNKQFGIGGSHLTGGFHKGPRKEGNAYEAFQAVHSDVINILGILSELIAANGGATAGITVPTQLLTVTT